MQKKVVYFKLDSGAQSRDGICAIIVQIDAIISSLLTTALISVGNANLIEYELDTGQSKQRVEYSTPGQITSAIKEYRKIRQLYANQLNSRVIKMVHYKNFR